MNNAEIEQLTKRIAKLEELAHARGLRPFKTNFHIVPSEIVYEFGAYGLPGRFSHWSHGRDYFRMKTSYDLGHSKIYELVVNTNPSLAFLLSNNNLTQNTFVAAHVFGHTDFFANNIHFANTERSMVEVMTLHAERLKGYEERFGKERVEQVLDAALALSPHVDDKAEQQLEEAKKQWEYDYKKAQDWRPERFEWSDLFPDQSAAAIPKIVGPTAPILGDDILYIIANYSASLEDWQRDALNIVRREQLYFAPQGRTKIFNEGWAVFWHLRLLRDLKELSLEEGVEIAETHAGVACPHPGSINPYYLGWQVLEAVNRQHGGDENTCADYLFALREREDDVSLLRNELTEEMIRDLDLFLFSEVEGSWAEPYIWQVCTSKEWEKVRDKLVNTLASKGRPRISVVSATHNYGELVLYHQNDGVNLDLPYAEKTLEYTESLWGRPVHLVTNVLNAKGENMGEMTLSYSRNFLHQRSSRNILT